MVARRWIVSGHVQGVGFRWFVVKCANEIGVRGWVRNEANGDVQAYAIGSEQDLDRLAAYLHQGPAHSTVRSVEQREAAVERVHSFEIR
jgi:acylphosphatase